MHVCLWHLADIRRDGHGNHESDNHEAEQEGSKETNGSDPSRRIDARIAALGKGARRSLGPKFIKKVAPEHIDNILADGARRAHDIADPILAKTKDIVGFIRG